MQWCRWWTTADGWWTAAAARPLAARSGCWPRVSWHARPASRRRTPVWRRARLWRSRFSTAQSFTAVAAGRISRQEWVHFCCCYLLCWNFLTALFSLWFIVVVGFTVRTRASSLQKTDYRYLQCTPSIKATVVVSLSFYVFFTVLYFCCCINWQVWC